MIYPVFFSPQTSHTDKCRKLAHYLKLDPSDTAVIENVFLMGDTEPVLVEKQQWPQLTENANKLIGLKSECMLGDLKQESATLPSETINEDFISCLKEPFNQFAAGVVVLRRKSSLGTDYYFATAYKFDFKANNIVDVPLRAEPFIMENYEGESYMVPNSMAGMLLAKFAGGLAGKLGDFVGSQLLSLLFGGNEKLDIEQLIGDIRNIIYEANYDQTILEQGGVINGVLEDIVKVYNLRRPHADKKTLTDMLSNYSIRIYSAINTLNKDKIKEPAIATYIAGIEMEMMLMQEFAYQDVSKTRPIESDYAKLIMNSVQNRIDFCNTVISDITEKKVKQRLGRISPPRFEYGSELVGSMWVAGEPGHLIIYSDDKEGKGKAKCQSDYNAYKNSVESSTRNNLREEFKNMTDALTQLGELKTKPLG